MLQLAKPIPTPLNSTYEAMTHQNPIISTSKKIKFAIFIIYSAKKESKHFSSSGFSYKTVLKSNKMLYEIKGNLIVFQPGRSRFGEVYHV